MPLLTVILALQFIGAVHALRRGVPVGLAFAIAILPIVGGLIYVVAVLVPALRPGPDNAGATALLGSADAAMARGDSSQAIALYRECLDGPAFNDPETMLKLAQAYITEDHPAAARETLEALARAVPDFRSTEGQLLYARALELEGRTADALREYEAICAGSDNPEARCRHALLLKAAGEDEKARILFDELLAAHADPGAKRARRNDRKWIEIARAERG